MVRTVSTGLMMKLSNTLLVQDVWFELEQRNDPLVIMSLSSLLSSHTPGFQTWGTGRHGKDRLPHCHLAEDEQSSWGLFSVLGRQSCPSELPRYVGSCGVRCQSTAGCCHMNGVSASCYLKKNSWSVWYNYAYILIEILDNDSYPSILHGPRVRNAKP